MEDSEMDKMDPESPVYMACLLQGHRLGVAFYDCLDQKLSVLEAWEEGDGDFSCLQILKNQIQPFAIYTSTKMDEKFISALRKSTDGTKDWMVKPLRSSIFSYEQAWHRLMFVQVNGMIKDSNVKERMYLLKSMMNLSNEMEVRAAGGLLQTLQEEMLIDLVKHNDNETNMLQIHNISEISMDRFLTLDFDTYGALQIFQTDKHPSDMGIGKPKEGFSLFGIFADRCATLMGRRLLRTWFLRPILDLDTINDRLDFIAIFLNLDEEVAAFHQSLRHVKDIPRLLRGKTHVYIDEYNKTKEMPTIACLNGKYKAVEEPGDENCGGGGKGPTRRVHHGGLYYEGKMNQCGGEYYH